jgi:hypothetical protein
MSKHDVGAGLRPAQADRRAASTKIFGKTVKAREGWGPEHLVHLHRLITPQNIEITGGRDAIHCRIHTHAAPGRKQTH